MPHSAEDATTVKVGGFPLLVDVDGFNCPLLSSWSPLASLWQPSSAPCAVCSMRALLSRSSHRVSSQLLCAHSASFQVFYRFPNIDALTIRTWYFIHYPFPLLVWLGLLWLHQGFPEGSLRFEGCSDAQVPALALYPLTDPFHVG